MRTLGAGRSRVIIALCSCAVALILSAGATPAKAVVAKIGGHGYGITPINDAIEANLIGAYRDQHSSTARAAARGFDEPPFGGSELENVESGPVMHSATTHVIYWDPPTSQFTSTTKGIVESFFGDVAHDSGLPTNAFPIAGQYTDSTGHAAYNSTFEGALVDSHAYPKTGNCTVPNEVDKGPYATCLFDKQLREELSTFIVENSLPKGPTQLYFVLLPHNVATCLPEVIEGKQVCSNNFYCAYHSSIGAATVNEIIYADIPFSLLDTSFAKGCQDDGLSGRQLPNGDEAGTNASTRFADIALKYISHEYIEAVTDPLVNVPKNAAWVDEFGLEIGDKCNGVSPDFEEDGIGYDENAFLPTLGSTGGSNTLFNQSIDGGSFYLQSQWDNAGEACLMKPLSLGAGSFAAPSATAGSPVGFTGSATDPYGSLDPAWTFGDGGSAKGVSPTHTYALEGEYTVTMTPKDSLTGSTGTPVSHAVKVAAPIVEFPLSVVKVGTGSGDIVSTPAGIECGGTCSATFAEGTEVTLTATAESGSTFVRWSGGACEGATANTCEVVIPAKALSVKAEFAASSSGGGTGGGGGTRGATGGPGVLTGSSTSALATAVTAPAPNSTFTVNSAANAKTGVIAVTLALANPGMLSWAATFPNGTFGAFSSARKCKAGQLRLAGKCRPAKIVFAKGSEAVGAAGKVTVTVKPSASASKALTKALKQKKGVPVSIVLTFRSSFGGAPVSHTQTVIDKPKKK